MNLLPDNQTSRRDFLRLLSLSGLAVASGCSSPNHAAQTAERRRPLGVALLGLGRYSTNQLGPALRETKNCRLAGVVSGHPEKLEKWAQDFGLPKQNLYS